MNPWGSEEYCRHGYEDEIPFGFISGDEYEERMNEDEE